MALLEQACKKIFPQDNESRDNARARLEQLTMPHWALGDLMDLGIELAGMTRNTKPRFDRKVVVTMAGDHGVVAEGVSKFPQEVTPQMVYNIVAGGAGINALAAQAGADVVVADLGVNADFPDLAEAPNFLDRKIAYGTNNIAVGPAMSVANARKAVETGIEIALELGDLYDMFGTGEMGIGNTTPSSAIAAVITGKPPAALTGRGTGLDDEQLERKIAIIEKILAVNKPDPNNGIDILAAIGGYEIGGIAGLILGAAAQNKPVMVDGFISTAGALVAYKIEPFIRDYIICSHRSVEPGHRFMQEVLGCSRPLLDLNFRLGEGTGGALAMNLIDASCRILSDVATFEEAAVAQANK